MGLYYDQKTKKKKARKPYISRKNTLKIINFEILVNLDPFIMFQNFYNIFFFKNRCSAKNFDTKFLNIWWKLSSQWFFKFLEFDEIYISGAIHHRLKPLIYWLIILVCNYFQNENILKIFPRYKIYNVRLRTSIFMNKWIDIPRMVTR